MLLIKGEPNKTKNARVLGVYNKAPKVAFDEEILGTEDSKEHIDVEWNNVFYHITDVIQAVI